MIYRVAILIFALQGWLSAALTFDSNYEKETQILRAFDLPPTFLYDSELQQIIKNKREKYKNHHFFKRMDEAYLFIPMIKTILSQSDIPSEFLFLAMAESGFSLEAYSRKKASGLWQFMPATGRTYGLKIDDYTDERRDLVKSTEAAVAYLESLYGRFGKWYLAALAYNYGEGNLARAIRRAGTDDIAVLIDDKKRYLPYESRHYIRKIVALTILGSDESFLINQEYAYLLNRADAYSIAPVTIAGGERLSRVAQMLEIPTETLRKLNRHLNYDFVPPEDEGYTIYIPYVKLSEFKQRYRPEKLRNIYRVHRVKKGESLASIGKKYHVGYKIIQDFNRLKGSMLQINQKLVIPVGAEPAAKRKQYYTVRPGDSLAKIAKTFNISIAQLKALNHLTSDTIHVGDRLGLND